MFVKCFENVVNTNYNFKLNLDFFQNLFKKYNKNNFKKEDCMFIYVIKLFIAKKI